MLTLELCRSEGIRGGAIFPLRTLIYPSGNVKNAFVDQEFPLNSGVLCPATWVWRLSHVSKKMWPASLTLCRSQRSGGGGGLDQLASVYPHVSGSSRRSAFKLGLSRISRAYNVPLFMQFPKKSKSYGENHFTAEQRNSIC